MVVVCWQESAELAQLEVEVELQGKIMAAALRLSLDRSRSRSIRKKRIQSFHRATDKVLLHCRFIVINNVVQLFQI